MWIRVLFIVALLLAPTSGQTRVGGDRQVEGNGYGSSDRTTGLSAASWSTRGDVVAWSNLQGGLYRSSAHLAKVDLNGTSGSGGSGQARVVVGGRTVSYSSFTTSGSRSWSPRTYDVLRVRIGWSFAGLVGFDVEGSAGAGSQFGATWTIDTRARIALLNGAAQVWGYGNGSAGIHVLWGVASARVSATLNYLNTTISFDLRGSPSGIGVSSARVSVILWELYCEFKAKILGETVARSTLVNDRGPTYSTRLF